MELFIISEKIRSREHILKSDSRFNKRKYLFKHSV